MVSPHAIAKRWQMQCTFIEVLLPARNLEATPFLFPVITEAPSEEKLASFLLSIPASSTCATRASDIVLLSLNSPTDCLRQGMQSLLCQFRDGQTSQMLQASLC